MHVLVCIKRVPGTGSSVELTPDGQAVDTRHLAFTIGPHEECAVEEAVQIAAAHGGSVTVLTVGPDDADEQLRYAVSMGADAAVRVDAGADPLDPQATAAAIAAALPELDPVDLMLFGNESADAGHYQVGIRVAVALGRPIVGGVKGVSVEKKSVRLERPVPGGVQVYEAQLPAAAAVMEGLNLPRYPSMRGRLRAAKASIRVIETEVAAGGLRPIRLHKPPETVKETVVLGKGPEAAPELADVLDELLSPADRSRSVGSTPHHEARVPSEDTSGLVAIELRRVDGSIEVVELPTATAEACGAALAAEVRRTAPDAVVASADPFGAEVMAHLAARLDLPLAANCTAVTDGEPWIVTRQRGGGVLLEDAELDAPIKLITVAAGATPFERPAELPEPRSIPLDGEPRARLVEQTSAGAGITLATAPVVVSGGRGIGSAEGFAVLEELAELLGGAVGCSRVVTNNGWRPHSDQVGQTGTKVAPKVYIAAGISGATQHWAGCMGSKAIVAINTDPEAPMVTRADYAVIGDAGDVLRATVSEIRRRRAR
ncbi:MAG TPA: FAD-binding protein [Jiangellaceae bacterium]